MKRSARSLAALILLLTTAWIGTGSAGAEEPNEYGYWTKAQTPASPNPSVPTAPTIPVAPPEQAVPEGGLLVALGPTTSTPDPAQPPGPAEPAAVSALRFFVEEGSEATLSLTVAEGQDGDGPSQQNTPAYQIDACTIDSTAPSWDAPEGAGRWEDRPTWDCDSVSTPAELEEDGQKYTWNLGGAFEVGGGVIDVVLVPRGVQDPNNPTAVQPVPFTLAFEAPDSQTLLVVPPPESAGGGNGGEDDFDIEEFSFDGFGSDETFDDFGPGSGMIEGGDGGTGGSEPPSPRLLDNPRVARPIAATPAPLDSRTERIMAVSLLLMIGTALWWVGGTPTRAPQLLGSLGDRSRPLSAGEATSGLGRFSRPRSGRPPRI